MQQTVKLIIAKLVSTESPSVELYPVKNINNIFFSFKRENINNYVVKFLNC